MSFTGERTEEPGNVVVCKHLSAQCTHRLRWKNYIEKLQYIVYEQKYRN